MYQNNTILICTGGTGGHVIPAVNFANFLIEQGYECSLILDKRGKYIILSGNQTFTINELLKMIKEILNDNDIQIEFTPDEYDAHYEMTPYTFNPKYGKKMYPKLQRDFGQGILQMIENIYRSIHPELKEQLGYLVENNKKVK